MKRALGQPMYLIDAEYKSLNEWYFTIQGYSGNSYETIITPNSMSCTCPDFQQRNKLCKHLYFIIARIAKDTDSLKKIKEETNIFDINPDFSEEIKQRLRNRLENSNFLENENENENEDCVICFENMINRHQKVSCQECKNKFHKACISKWLRKKDTCPLCRTKIVINQTQQLSNDSLEHFNNLVIN